MLTCRVEHFYEPLNRSNPFNQSCKTARAFRVGPGSGLSLSKWFGPITDLHTKLFYKIKSKDFLSWRTFVVLNKAPLNVALPKMFVNLVLIPGINSLSKHAFSSNQIGSVVWVDVLHRASTSKKRRIALIRASVDKSLATSRCTALVVMQVNRHP